MKDESRAKWPEGMKSGDALRICEGYYQTAVYGKDHRGTAAIFYGQDAETSKSRALAGAALPAMVALLKRVMKDSVNEEMLNDTRAILAQIGEVE